MKSATILLPLLILSILGVQTLSAQQWIDPDKQYEAFGSNAEGTLFIVGFMQNEIDYCGYWGGRLRISIASRFPTQVTITLPNGAGTIERQLNPFQVTDITFSNSNALECRGPRICDETVKIESLDPVTVYVFSSKTHTSDGYLALPVDSWGTEYVSANYAIDIYPDTLDCSDLPRAGEFAMIASQDSTVVQVWPKAPLLGGAPANQPVTAVLNAGEMWQVQANGFYPGTADLTGSRVISNKPIGFLSGHMRVGIPLYAPSKDHLIEMLPPVTALGNRYAVIPFGGRLGGDRVRVIATEAGQTSFNVITDAGIVQHRLAAPGDFTELEVYQPTTIESDRTVEVVHYSQSNMVDPTSSFDPYMIVVSPEEQFVNAAVFQTMPNDFVGDSQFRAHFVTFVVEAAHIAQTRLNGVPFSALDPSVISAVGPVPGLNDRFRYITLRLQGGRAYVAASDGLFGGYVYGIGPVDSYGWPVGTGLRNVEIPDDLPPIIYGDLSCGGTVVDIVVTDSTITDAGLISVELDPASVNVAWDVEPLITVGATLHRGTIRLIDPTRPGTAIVRSIDVDSNVVVRTFDLTPTLPVISESEINFVDVPSGPIVQKLISISNDGDTNIIIDSVRLASGNQFDVIGGGAIRQTVTPTGWYDLTVVFQTTTEGVFRDTLLIWIDCQLYRIPLQASTAVPVIGTEDLDFGPNRLGTMKCLDLLVRNTGKGELVIWDILMSGRRYSFASGGVPDLPIRLQSGQDTVVRICFSPEARPEELGTVLFKSNAAGGDSVAQLVGRGIYPRLQIGSYDFGAVEIGDTACSVVPVINGGNDTATVTGIGQTPNGTFLVDDDQFPVRLPPGDTLWVRVCFAPKESTPVVTQTLVANEDGLEATGELTGSGYELFATISGYDWERRRVGTDHDTVVFIRNTGNAPVEIRRVWIENGDESDFSITLPVPAFTLGADEIREIPVRFSPLMRGARSIGIYAETSARQTPVIENILEGFGIEPLPSDELRHDPSLAWTCEPRVSEVLVYNRGNMPLTIETVSLSDPSGRVALDAPPAGSQIPVGDTPIEIELSFDPDGFEGVADAIVSWSFRELPNEVYSRSVQFSTAHQRFALYARTPQAVSVGESFDLMLGIDSAFWGELKHTRLTFDIAYNPSISMFDRERFFQSAMSVSGGMWRWFGAPEFPSEGVVRLHLESTEPSGTVIDRQVFPPLPFRAFLGNSYLDTFRITASVDSDRCVVADRIELPYRTDSLCGLNFRLFTVAGEAPALKEARPNPASGVVEIDYTVTFAGPLTIEFFAAGGARLHEFRQASHAAGRHTLTLDVSRWPAGAYYYRLTTPSWSGSRRFVVTK